MKKLLVAALMVLLASPAFAAIQDVKVSGSVTSYFVDRSNFDLNSPPAVDSKYEQNFFYTSTHVLISSDLSDNVSAQVGLANEVVWGDQSVSNATLGGGSPSNASDQNVDLELANITLREFLYSPLTLTIGRQSLSYGNDFIIGAAGFTSVGTMANVATDMSRTMNYDGVRAVLDYKPLTIDMVYVKTNSNHLAGLGNRTTTAGTNNDDQDLYGGVANYQLSDPFSTVVEGSFWARIDRSVNVNGSPTDLAAGAKPTKLFVPDLRVSTNPTKDLNVGLEGALQFGNNYVSSAVPDANEKITRAFSLQGRASYNIPVLEKYKPNVSDVVSYYSGNPGHGTTGKSSDKTSAWTTMYNDQDLGTTIWRALFTPSNLMTNELSFSVAPLEDVTAKVTWTDLMLADTLATPADVISAGLPDGEAAGSEPIKDKRGLGNEVDGIITYAYTEDVSFGLNLGMFKPGSLFTSHDSKASATEAIASVGVNF
jgi:hypothetical protein